MVRVFNKVKLVCKSICFSIQLIPKKEKTNTNENFKEMGLILKIVSEQVPFSLCTVLWSFQVFYFFTRLDCIKTATLRNTLIYMYFIFSKKIILHSCFLFWWGKMTLKQLMQNTRKEYGSVVHLLQSFLKSLRSISDG